MAAEDALTAAGGVLYVLTADDPAVLTKAIRKKKFEATFVPVDASIWTTWDVVNPSRTELPHPTTLVVAPDGTVVFRETHENFRERTMPSEVVALVKAARSGFGRRLVNPCPRD
jgi:peroxiredoxin